MKPIALVIPWYGDNIKGGAEQECNYLAHSLKDEGVQVEVLTTCVKEASADRGINTLEAGDHIESGILVRRFKVRKRNLEKFVPANLKIYHGEAVSLEEEKDYFSEDINSPEMYKFIQEHKDDYRCFVFIPYMYGLTYNGSKACPDNCIIIPCLHDESYAYMRLVKEMMERMKGIIYLSEPECMLAKRLFTLDNVRTAVLGAEVDATWIEDCNPERFRSKYGIKKDFILFAGRKDSGKKADELLSYYNRYIEINPHRKVELVFIGGGNIEIPEKCRDKVHDLGFISAEDKHDALSASSFLCNPSYFESFSIVIMESWLAKRPVLVSEHCAVTTNFCLETNGGLFFKDFSTFAGATDFLLDNNGASKKMGENGFKYVMENFTHEIIGKKYLDFINLCVDKDN